MKTMSWEYLAGFFDGEGSIRQDSACHWSIAQGRERGLQLFREIQEFLAGHGIKASIHVRREPDKVHTLYVSNRKDVSYLISHLYPYLRIKRVECQDALRFMKLYPSRSSGAALALRIRETRRHNHGNAGEHHAKARLTHAQVDDIRLALSAGTRCSEIARSYGVHYNTIAAIKHGKNWNYHARV